MTEQRHLCMFLVEYVDALTPRSLRSTYTDSMRQFEGEYIQIGGEVNIKKLVGDRNTGIDSDKWKVATRDQNFPEQSFSLEAPTLLRLVRHHRNKEIDPNNFDIDSEDAEKYLPLWISTGYHFLGTVSVAGPNPEDGVRVMIKTLFYPRKEVSGKSEPDNDSTRIIGAFRWAAFKYVGENAELETPWNWEFLANGGNGGDK